MTPGEKLRLLRQKKGFTQVELADKLNAYAKSKTMFTRDSLANWELDRHEPKWPEAKVLVRYFNITLDNLFFEEDTSFLRPAKGKNIPVFAKKSFT